MGVPAQINPRQEGKPLPTKAQQEAISKLVLKGDLHSLSDTEKTEYYRAFCEHLNIDPVTKPFDLLTSMVWNEATRQKEPRTVLYANASCAQQLGNMHRVKHYGLRTVVDEENMVIRTDVVAESGDGRSEEDAGLVSLLDYSGNRMRGSYFADAVKKSITQAKRRSTLSLFGLSGGDDAADTVSVAIVEAPKDLIEDKGMPAQIEIKEPAPGKPAGKSKQAQATDSAISASTSDSPTAESVADAEVKSSDTGTEMGKQDIPVNDAAQESTSTGDATAVVPVEAVAAQDAVASIDDNQTQCQRLTQLLSQGNHQGKVVIVGAVVTALLKSRYKVKIDGKAKTVEGLTEQVFLDASKDIGLMLQDELIRVAKAEA